MNPPDVPEDQAGFIAREARGGLRVVGADPETSPASAPRAADVAAAIVVLVVEAFPIMRAAMCSVLSSERSFSIPGSADDAATAIAMALELRPDVIVLDLHLPDSASVRVLDELRRNMAHARVLVMSTSEDPQVCLDVMARGAAGFLSKGTNGPQLIHAVRSVAGGGTALSPLLASCLAQNFANMLNADVRSPSSSETVPEHNRRSSDPTSDSVPRGRAPNSGRAGRAATLPDAYRGLTDAEVSALIHAANGLTDSEIANAMFVSNRSVQNYLLGARTKLGLRNRADVARWVADHDLTER